MSTLINVDFDSLCVCFSRFRCRPPEMSRDRNQYGASALRRAVRAADDVIVGL